MSQFLKATDNLQMSPSFFKVWNAYESIFPDVIGKNATFGGSGSITGQVSLNTTSTELLTKTKVYKYDANGTNGQNDYFGFTYVLQNGDKGSARGLSFLLRTLNVLTQEIVASVKIVGGTSDGQIRKTYLDLSLIPNVANAYFDVPQDATSLVVGFQNLSTNTAAKFWVDNIALTTKPFDRVNVVTQEAVSYTGYLSGSTGGMKLATKDAARSTSGNTISDDNSGSYTKYTILKKANVVLTAAVDTSVSGANYLRIDHYNSSASLVKSAYSTAGSTAATEVATMTTQANVGDFFLLIGSTTNVTNGTTTSFLITASSVSENVIQSWSPGIGNQIMRIYHAAASSALDYTGEFRFNLATANITNKYNGADYSYSSTLPAITAVDDAANTRTKFVANAPCIVTVSVDGSGTGGGLGCIVSKNGVTANGPDLAWGNGVNHNRNTFSIDLLAGDYVTVGMLTGYTVTSSEPIGVSIMAIPQITAPALLALPSSKENRFTAEIINPSGSPTVGQKSSDWIESLSYDSPGFVYIQTKNLGLTVNPAVIAQPRYGSPSSTSIYNLTIANGKANFGVIQSSGGAFNSTFSVTLDKQGPDYTCPGVFVGNIAKEQVAYLKDAKPNGTNGGTFTSGSWQTRDLNIVEGDISFVALSSNIFTLQAGEYDIEVTTPAYYVDSHKCGIALSASSTPDVAVGSNTYTMAQNNGVLNHSFAKKRLTVTSPTSYKIVHRCSATYATQGLGMAISMGVDEIYTQVKIRKLA